MLNLPGGWKPLQPLRSRPPATRISRRRVGFAMVAATSVARAGLRGLQAHLGASFGSLYAEK